MNKQKFNYCRIELINYFINNQDKEITINMFSDEFNISNVAAGKRFRGLIKMKIIEKREQEKKLIGNKRYYKLNKHNAKKYLLEFEKIIKGIKE